MCDRFGKSGRERWSLYMSSAGSSGQSSHPSHGGHVFLLGDAGRDSRVLCQRWACSGAESSAWGHVHTQLHASPPSWYLTHPQSLLRDRGT